MELSKIETESLRLNELYSLEILDTLPQERYDDITLLASEICNVPIALISLIDENRQWFKSKVGLDALETPREYAFCDHAIRRPNELFIIHNALEDERFRNNPLVTGDPNIRFYAGSPLVTSSGYAVGTLCVIDRIPRELSQEQLRALEALKRSVLTLFENRRALKEIKEAELKVRESERYLNSIINNVPALIGYWDRDLLNKFSNQKYFDWFGKDKESVINRPMLEVIGEKTYNVNLPYIKKVLAGEVQNFENDVLTKNGENLKVEVSYIPDLENDEVKGFYVLVFDITKLKNIEHSLKELNATKDKFFSIIAHDLRGPLGTLKEFLVLLHDTYDDFTEDEKREFLSAMKDSSKNIYALLENLLVWSRSQIGAIAIEYDEVNINMLISDIMSLTKQNAEKKHIAIISEIDGDLELKADINMLNTIIRNLVSNAIKFTPENGKIIIKVDNFEDKIQFSIIDNGVGMNEITSSRLFKIGETRSTEGTKGEQGTGLGLILCKEFVDKHKGSIWVESELKVGSKFIFTVPK